MSTPSSVVQPQRAQAPLPDYLAIFSDQQPPRDCQFTEHPLTALSDIHAEDLMQREYPSCRWTLYRIDHNGQRTEVCSYFGEK